MGGVMDNKPSDSSEGGESFSERKKRRDPYRFGKARKRTDRNRANRKPNKPGYMGQRRKKRDGLG